MTTAFGRAMLASINGNPQRFRMTMGGGQPLPVRCSDFLNTRAEENQLLDRLELPENAKVLDWGCGLGRHLLQVRQGRPSVHCYGIEICDGMLGYLQKRIAPPATFVESFEELDGLKFDLIMLMGNGLGVLGSEQDATQKLASLVGSLRQGGRILIETSNPFGAGYYSNQFEIDYEHHHDGPFVWGGSDKEWIRRILGELGCTVRIEPSKGPGGCFFAIGTKDNQHGTPPPIATVEQFKQALLALRDKNLPAGHLAMLNAQCSASEASITSTKLAEAAGYDNYNAANLQYGTLAFNLAGFLSYNPPKRKDGTPMWWTTLSYSLEGNAEPETGQFQFIMRPELVTALRAMKWVK